MRKRTGRIDDLENGALLGFLWRSVHHEGHEDHEEKQFKHKEGK
jgi:hypothetical protein